MKTNKTYKNKLIILLLILILLLTNCTINKNDTKLKKKDRAPDSISDVSDNIQDILKNTEKIEMILDGTYIEKEEKKEKKEEEKKTEEGDESGESDDIGNKSEESKDPESEKQNEASKEEKKPDKAMESKTEEEEKDKINEDLKKFWEKTEDKLQDVHEKWNDFEAEGTKKGMTREDADDFSNSLNDLTKSIEEKNIANIYDFGAECFLNLSSIFNIYKDEIKGEINKIKYSVYKSYLMGVGKKNNKAETILEDGEKSISLIRSKTKEEDEEKLKSLEKLNLSILDMKKSLSKDSIKLIRIKKDIIIKNLEELNN